MRSEQIAAISHDFSGNRKPRRSLLTVQGRLACRASSPYIAFNFWHEGRWWQDAT
jgi:hypothetical protein